MAKHQKEHRMAQATLPAVETDELGLPLTPSGGAVATAEPGEVETDDLGMPITAKSDAEEEGPPREPMEAPKTGVPTSLLVTEALSGMEERCVVCDGQGSKPNPAFEAWRRNQARGIKGYPPLSGERIECVACNGLGVAPNAEGQRLIAFIKRHLKLG